LRVEKLESRHRAAFEKFTSELDMTTTYNYTHFGYEVEGREAADRVFKAIGTRATRGYVLIDKSKIVGFGHLDAFSKREKRHVVKLGIVMHPEYQGKGFGKKLLDYMIAVAEEEGIEKIWLATYADNPRALELYRSRGFVVEGVFRREEKVGRRYRDVVSMALFLRKVRKRD